MSNKPWLQHYPDYISNDNELDEIKDLASFFIDFCHTFSDKIAFKNFNSNITFSQLSFYSDILAAYLMQTLELKKGDRVALMLENIIQFPVAFFAVIKAGLIVVNVNPLYTERELQHQLKDSGAIAIILSERCASTLEAVVSNTSIQHIILTKFGDMLGYIQGAVINFAARHIKKIIPKHHLKNSLNLKKILSTKLKYIKPYISSSDIALLQYTGGTTGVAKGAAITHKNLYSNIIQLKLWVAHGLTDNETVVTCLPLYHIFSLTVTMAFASIGVTSLLITNPRDFHNFNKILLKNDFTLFVGINTLFKALMNTKNFKKINFKNLKHTFCGGMSTQSDVADKWHQLTGTVVIEGYGLTEASPVISIMPTYDDSHTGFVGFPLPRTELEIRDEQGVILKAEEKGQVFVRGPQVMHSYWQHQYETDKVLSKDGWLATGDIGYLNSIGELRIVDREKDMIIVSGFNVYPAEVEDVLSGFPGVIEVAVVSDKTSRSCEVVKAFIYTLSHDLTAESLSTFCHERMAAYKCPKVYSISSNPLPKSNVGKILRKNLRS